MIHIHTRPFHQIEFLPDGCNSNTFLSFNPFIVFAALPYLCEAYSKVRPMIIMKHRFTFYLFIAALVVLDAVLLRSPNLLGKLGLILYKYHYLRTFPKALLTVTLVVIVSVIIAEGIRFMVKKEVLKKFTGQLILFFLMTGSIGILVKTGMDFTAWSYSHTGLRFRIGAYLLPAILVVVFFYAMITVPEQSFPVSPLVKEGNDEEVS